LRYAFYFHITKSTWLLTHPFYVSSNSNDDDDDDDDDDNNNNNNNNNVEKARKPVTRT